MLTAWHREIPYSRDLQPGLIHYPVACPCKACNSEDIPPTMCMGRVDSSITSAINNALFLILLLQFYLTGLASVITFVVGLRRDCMSQSCYKPSRKERIIAAPVLKDDDAWSQGIVIGWIGARQRPIGVRAESHPKAGSKRFDRTGPQFSITAQTRSVEVN